MTVPTDPPEKKTPAQVRQSILSDVQAEKITTGDITQIGQQTVIQPQPRPKPTGIPQNIPFRGSRYFIGREAVLNQLHQSLSPNQSVVISACAGMGGVG
jgi:hypothetical protein